MLEHAATALLQEVFDAQPVPAAGQGENDRAIRPPADLFVLINEAGAASIAKPFLTRLKQSGLTYDCESSLVARRPRPGPGLSSGGQSGPSADSQFEPQLQQRSAPLAETQSNKCPLLLSMTSEGDLATKFAYPGGEALSWNRRATQKHPTDEWGQQSDTTYQLITAANFVALQSHRFTKMDPSQVASAGCLRGTVTLPGKQTYCLQSLNSHAEDLKQHPNNTPYWLMQLPQVFVPDHGTVFQDSFLEILEQFVVGPRASLTVRARNVSLLQSR